MVKSKAQNFFMKEYISSIIKPNLEWFSQLYPELKENCFVGKNINFGLIGSLSDNLITFAEDMSFYDESLKYGNLSMILVSDKMDVQEESIKSNVCVVHCDDPRQKFFELFSEWTEQIIYPETFISDKAVIHDSTIVSSKGVFIDDGVVIGANSIIEQGVIIGRKCQIGSFVILGEDGFEVKKINGINKLIKHDGLLIIDEEVVVKSLSKIDKGIMGIDTKIGYNTVIDSHVHIGHSVSVGRQSLIVSNTLLSGSSTIGSSVYVGPGCTISNGVVIGDNSRVTLGSTVVSKVLKNQQVSGYFSTDHKTFLKQRAKITLLAE
jgi:UDP-3-O-[3-hydroxymyristoyl] glucosamine N-acyltransferase